MSTLRAIALFVILAFGGVVIAAGFMTAPASVGKMDGKPGRRNNANYGPTNSATPKPPTSTEKTPGQ